MDKLKERWTVRQMDKERDEQTFRWKERAGHTDKWTDILMGRQTDK